MNRKVITTASSCVGIALAAAFAYSIFAGHSSNPKVSNLTKVQSYRYVETGAVSCTAMMPECGVCYGEVINKECYVDKDKLDSGQRSVMGF